MYLGIKGGPALMPKGNLKFKELDVRRGIRAFHKTGLQVGRVEIDREGKIVIVAAKAKSPASDDSDDEKSWDKKVTNAANKKRIA
jgi:hypothetical protein